MWNLKWECFLPFSVLKNASISRNLLITSSVFRSSKIRNFSTRLCSKIRQFLGQSSKMRQFHEIFPQELAQIFKPFRHGTRSRWFRVIFHSPSLETTHLRMKLLTFMLEKFRVSILASKVAFLLTFMAYSGTNSKVCLTAKKMHQIFIDLKANEDIGVAVKNVKFQLIWRPIRKVDLPRKNLTPKNVTISWILRLILSLILRFLHRPPKHVKSIWRGCLESFWVSIQQWFFPSSKFW